MRPTARKKSKKPLFIILFIAMGIGVYFLAQDVPPPTENISKPITLPLANEKKQ